MVDDYSNFSPPIRSIDELSLVSDVGLNELEKYYQSQILRGRLKGFSTYEYEVELCYIQRECEIRELRALMHKQWLEEGNSPDEDWICDDDFTFNCNLKN